MLLSCRRARAMARAQFRVVSAGRDPAVELPRRRVRSGGLGGLALGGLAGELRLDLILAGLGDDRRLGTRGAWQQLVVEVRLEGQRLARGERREELVAGGVVELRFVDRLDDRLRL